MSDQWQGAKPIETRYKGHRFRSRLEARWAVFMDAAGIEWLYEPQGFDLDGLWYLPDFWLPQQRVWLEVKYDVSWDFSEQFKRMVSLAWRLAHRTDAPVLFLVSVPDPIKNAESAMGLGGYLPNSKDEGDMDYGYQWANCLSCGAVGLANADEFSDGVALLPCEHTAFGSLPALAGAYERARSARFEHGERG